MSVRVQLRHDTAANWTTANPTLAAGEKGLESDTGREKNGDGVTAWGALPYIDASTLASANTYTDGKITTTGGDLAAQPWVIRGARMKMRQLATGDVGVQLDIAVIGDSYSQNRTRWTGPFWQAMSALFGDAGVGWVGFAYPVGLPNLINGSVRPDTTVTVTGTWTPNYTAGRGPDLGEMSSSTVGDKIVVTFPAGQASGKLFYKVTAGATATAQFAGGGSQALDLSLVGSGASNLGVVTLTAPSAAATTLTVTVTGGTVALCGVDLRKTSNGVRVHKIAATGSTAQQWAGVDATSWKAGLTALAPDLVIVMHGPNDQTGGTAAATFAGYINTILTNARAALPAVDLAVVTPPENQRGLTPTMVAYGTATRPIALTAGAAYLNLQPAFGDTAASYAFGSTRPWFASDNLHPDPATGGRIIADAVLRAMFTDTPAPVGTVTSGMVGAASGVAPLDGNAHLPAANLPDLSALYAPGQIEADPWTTTDPTLITDFAIVGQAGHSPLLIYRDGTTEIAKLKAGGATFRNAIASWATSPAPVFALTDPTGRSAATAYADGTVEITKLKAGGATYVDQAADSLGDLFALVDSSGRAAVIARKSGKLTLNVAADSRIPATLVAPNVLALGTVQGAVPLAMPANAPPEAVFTLTAGTSNLTLSVTGAASGVLTTLRVVFTQGSTARTVTWPTGTKWAAGTAPTVSTTAAAVDIYELTSPNGGTTWYGRVVGQNFS